MKPRMKHVLTESLSPYEKNPRKNEKAIEAVAQSISQNGFVQPILVDQNMRICIGHTRWMAAQELELEEVPVIVKEMNEQEFIKLNIADNKTGELADWDEEKLSDLIRTLDSEYDDIEIPGLEFSEIDKLLFSEDESGPGQEEKESTQSETSKSPTRKLIYIFSIKDANSIDGKLQAIKDEQGLDTDADALLFALKSFKGPKRVKVSKGDS